MWELDYKESWAPKNWCFWTVVLEKMLENPLDFKEILPKGDQFWVFIGRTDVEAETPILWPPDAKSWLIWKDPNAGKYWGQDKKGMTEDEMVGWHHQHNGHGFGWTLGVGDGQGGLACCGSWGRKESDMNERLNWTEWLMMLSTFSYTDWSFAYLSVQFRSVQSFSHVWLFATPWTAARQASLSITSCQSSPKPRSTESLMPFNHLILYRSLLLLPSIFPKIRVFSNESAVCIGGLIFPIILYPQLCLNCELVFFLILKVCNVEYKANKQTNLWTKPTQTKINT